MKIKNIFKKGTKTVAKANVEKLEKKHLEKVVGGVETTVAKQTQGATFGEKVNNGLHAAGGA